MEVIRTLQRQVQFRRIISRGLQLLAFSLFVVCIIATFLGSWNSGWITGILILLGGIILAAITGKFLKPDLEDITRFLDRNYPFTEESAHLLLEDPEQDTLGYWQQQKVKEQIQRNASNIEIPNRQLRRAGGIAGLWFVLAALIFVMQPRLTDWLYTHDIDGKTLSEQQKAEQRESLIPGAGTIAIQITPPAYTNMNPYQTGYENIRVPENSRVEWQVETTDSVKLLFSNAEVSRLSKQENGNLYRASVTARENRIYQLVFSNADTTIYSEFKSISIVNDQPPGFVIERPLEQRDYITPQKRTFKVEARIGDDYGIMGIQLQATLARGSGENVRFRERTLSFDRVEDLGSNEVLAQTILNADSLEMEPGDELYFYITATDNKPEAQQARSETYFIIYADSGEVAEMEVAGFGVDLLPEYFRSQRQIIIDTEKLLADKPNISEEEFKDRSDLIGYNQNLLRKRYGAYLGQEDEMSYSEGTETVNEDVTHAEEHDGAEAEDHDHTEEDGELNEMGLENAESDQAAVIPDEFFHDHGAAEMNTLYAESPRALLKQAIDNMWNSERYLRTYRPEKALPYEYAALKFLKAVQQANRQYTRKAGYELPPIPEGEKRLSGTYDDFANPDAQKESLKAENPLVQLLLLFTDPAVSVSEESLIAKANELVQRADITDADRLYLLNRIRLLENEGPDEMVTDEITGRITRINRRLQMDPAPDILPAIQQSSRP